MAKLACDDDGMVGGEGCVDVMSFDQAEIKRLYHTSGLGW